MLCGMAEISAKIRKEMQSQRLTRGMLPCPMSGIKNDVRCRSSKKPPALIANRIKVFRSSELKSGQNHRKKPMADPNKHL